MQLLGGLKTGFKLIFYMEACKWVMIIKKVGPESRIPTSIFALTAPDSTLSCYHLERSLPPPVTSIITEPAVITKVASAISSAASVKTAHVLPSFQTMILYLMEKRDKM